MIPAIRTTPFPLLLALTAALCVAGALALFLAYPAHAQADGDPPAEPTGLEASQNPDGGADLAWDDPSDDSITGYEIFRRDRNTQEAGEFDSIRADTGSADADYTDATAQPGGSYVYRVKAINPHGRSVWSGYARIDLPEEQDESEE